MVKKTDFGSMFATNTAKKNKNLDKIDLESPDSDNKAEKVVELAPHKCVNWRFADRQEFELGDLRELGQDIAQNGQTQPIIVRPKEKGVFEVIAGERRWRACTLLDIKVKAVIVEATDEDCFSIQNSENIRADISPYSKSKSYFKIINELSISQNKLAEKLNIKKSSFSELLSFNFVDDSVWDAVEDMRKVSINTASYMRKLINEDKNNIAKLIKIADKIKRGAGRAAISKALEKEKPKEAIIKNKYFTIKNGIIKIYPKYLDTLEMKTLEKNISLFFEQRYKDEYQNSTAID